MRGTGRTVATGCGRTASEASLGVTDTERVSTTAFLSKIRPDWADAALFPRISSSFVSPFVPIHIASSTARLVPSSPLTFPRQQHILRSASVSRHRLHKPSHEPYANWSILISRFHPPFLAYFIVSKRRLHPPLFPTWSSHSETCRSHGHRVP